MICLNSLFIYFIFDIFLFKSDCLILRGSKTVSNKDWLLIGKFCFISIDSKLSFKFEYGVEYKTQNLLLYYDNQWSKVYSKQLDCKQREAELGLGQKIPLLETIETAVKTPLCLLDSSNKTLTCVDGRGFVSARARYWFVVISNCDQNKGISINYDITFTNGNGVFQHHFSADEFGIFETSISLFVAYFILLIIGFLYAKILINKCLLHITFKLFLTSLLIQFLSFLFTMSEYAQFSSSGINTEGMLTIARLFDAIAQTIFLFMLILIAKGYTVTRGKLRKITKLKLIILLVSYIISFVITFIYSEVLFDPGIINYFYNSPPGIALICIKLIFGWGWFIYSIIFTLKNYPEKRAFYVMYLIFFSIWFISGPFVLMACAFLVADHVKQFVGFITLSIISFVGHSFFLFLTRPTSGNKSFPYHVRTNQIVAITTTPTILGEIEEKQNFPHHKENDGGNTNFDNELKLDNIFSVKNTGDKYLETSSSQTIQ